jgi:hypothetical protein
MTGDDQGGYQGGDQDDCSAVREAVADARRKAAAALARLAEAGCGGPAQSGSVWWCRCPVCSATATPRPNSPTDPDSSRAKHSRSRSLQPSMLTAATRSCSPGSSPMMAAGSNQDPFCRRHHRGKTLRTMTGSRLRRLQELAPRHGKGLSTFAGDEGGESARPPVGVQLAEHGSPALETTMASTGACPTPNATDASTNHYKPEWQPDGRQSSGG